MAEKKNKTLEKARIEMNYLTGDKEVQRLAELREKWEMDYISGTNYAREEGRAEGKAEGKIEIAKKLKAKGYDKQEISEITGLAIEEIEKI